MRNRHIPIFVLLLFAGCGDDPAAPDDSDATPDVADSSDADTSADAPNDAEHDAEPDAEHDAEPDAEPDAEHDAESDAERDTLDPCAPDQCEIDGECYANDAPNPDNPCEICLVVVDAGEWSNADGGICDDGDACTADDACFEGTCMGTLATCDDGNACTSGTCDPETGECEWEPTDGSCDDGDPCSVGDICNDGVCTAGSETLGCDDDNGCTDDVCEPGIGCTFPLLDGAACDDGDACTDGDVCGGGTCVPGPDPVVCDDESLCTIDWCDPVDGCRTRSIADLCSDENPCTDEACDPELGCVFPFNEEPCDDGLVCTGGDTCTEGACRGALVPVDDENLCTDDTCVEPDGPISVPNSDPCDDGDACTVGDICADGGCIPGTDPLVCDDDNVCTDDACDVSDGCTFTPNTDACDDGNACTVEDACGDGECVGAELSCDDGNDCTVDSCDIETGCINTLIVSNACRPTIEIDYPPRAATIEDDGSGTITVRGRVVSGAGPIEALTVNGELVTPAADGAFTHELTSAFGGNYLLVEAADSMGSERRVVQSFLLSDDYRIPTADPLGGHEPQGMGFYLGQPSLDVLASVTTLAFSTLDLSGLLPDPVLVEFFHTVRPRGAEPVSFGTPTATLDAQSGGIHMTAVVPDLRAEMTISGWLCSGNVDYTATSLTLDADIILSVVDHELVTSLENVDATISGADISIGCLLGGIIEALIGDISGDFESTIESQLTSQLGPLLTEAFGAFAIDMPIEFPALNPGDPPVAIQLQTDFESVDFDDDGGNIVLRSVATSEPLGIYSNLGVAGRSSCGAAEAQLIRFFEEDPLEVVLSDNTINQLLYSAWSAGLLEFDVPPELLGDFDLSGFGISDLVLHASGMLQPTIADCVDDTLVAHIGDLRIDADMSLLGTALSATLYVSLTANFEITAADGALGFAISDIARVELQVEVEDEAFISVESTFEALILENLVPGLMGALGGDALGSFPLPEIDLAGTIEGVPAGTVLSITPSRVRRLLGNAVVGGTMGL